VPEDWLPLAAPSSSRCIVASVSAGAAASETQASRLEVLTAGRRKIHFDLGGAHDVITIAQLAHSPPPSSCWLKHKQSRKGMMNSFHE
jgi:hypothetical protein